MSFEFEGKIYRDDRMYVINLSIGKSGNKEKHILVTYRNIPQLPAFRVDEFDTKEEATKYLKEVEPKTPLTSLNKQPLSIPENVDNWEYWLNWLKDRNLKSAISGFQNLPHWVSQKEVSGKSNVDEHKLK